MRSEERFSRNAETDIDTLSLHDALPISENLPRFAWSTPQRQKLKFLPLRRYNLTLNLLSRSHEIGRAVQQECRDRYRHSFPTRRSSDLRKPTALRLVNPSAAKIKIFTASAL